MELLYKEQSENDPPPYNKTKLKDFKNIEQELKKEELKKKIEYQDDSFLDSDEDYDKDRDDFFRKNKKKFFLINKSWRRGIPKVSWRHTRREELELVAGYRQSKVTGRGHWFTKVSVLKFFHRSWSWPDN